MAVSANVESAFRDELHLSQNIEMGAKRFTLAEVSLSIVESEQPDF